MTSQSQALTTYAVASLLYIVATRLLKTPFNKISHSKTPKTQQVERLTYPIKASDILDATNREFTFASRDVSAYLGSVAKASVLV